MLLCSNDDPGLALTYFMPRSNLVTYAFLWEKGKLLATGPLEAKLHMEPLWDMETKVSLNVPGHMAV